MGKRNAIQRLVQATLFAVVALAFLVGLLIVWLNVQSQRQARFAEGALGSER